MALAETAELTVRLSLKDGLTRGVQSSIRSLDRLNRSTSNTQRALSKTARNLELGFVAVGAGILGTVKAAADYESAFAGVRKTVNASQQQLDKLSQEFRDLAKTIPISADEFARLGEAAGALGIGEGLKDPTSAIKEFTRVTALLGVTTNLTADEAADSLGRISNVLKLNEKDYSRFASALVALGNAGASTESEIIQIAERAGAAGKLIGASTEEVLGFSSAVASIGVEPEAGGTSLQKFFIDTAKAVSAGGKDLKVFAKTAGVTAKAFKKAYQDDAGQALAAFVKGLGKLNQGDQLKVLQDLGFTDQRITRTLLGLANNYDLLSGQLDIANKGFAENTALTKEAEQRFKTFDSQVAILKNNLRDAAITIGSKLLPKLTPLVQRLTKFIQDNQGKIESFGDELASAFERFASEAQKVDWGAIVDGLKLSGQAAKAVVDAFNALPGPLKSLLIAGFAANKVTGGLVTGIGKDLVGALFGKLRGATPLNPMYVAVVGGGIGAGLPGAAGGAAGAAGGIGLGAVATVGAVGVTLIGGTAVSLRSIADYAGKNYQLQKQGLTEQEIAAQRYYNGSQADRQQIIKHLGYQPTKADFESGNRKLETAMATVASTVRESTHDVGFGRAGGGSFGPPATGFDKVVGAISTLASVLKPGVVKASLTERNRVLGFSGKVDKTKSETEVTRTLSKQTRYLTSHTSQDAVVVARALTSQFETSQRPFYRDITHQTAALEALKGLQQRFLDRGDVKSAAAIGADINALETVIKRNKPSVHVNVNVSQRVTVRDENRAKTTHQRYSSRTIAVAS